MDVFRLGLKIYLDDSSRFELRDLITVFHGWIQRQVLPGHLLIDVHDYSHVHHGPGILLVGHEGNISLDQAGGRPGLFYYRKQPAPPGVDVLDAVFETALRACRLLEEEPALQGGLRFDPGQSHLVISDRLAAPNTPETFRSIEPRLSAILTRLYSGEEFELAQEADPRERFAIDIRTSSRDVASLLERLAVA